VGGRPLKGVVLSTEVILVLAAVLILGLVVALGLGRMVMSQAASEKATALINEAHVRLFYRGSISSATCQLTSVTFYMTNFGDRKIWVVRVEIVQPDGRVFTVASALNVQVNPGETMPVSARAPGCPSLTVGGTKVTSVFLQVTYSTDDGRSMTVGKPVKVEEYVG